MITDKHQSLNLKSHWEKAYTINTTEKLGWYENDVTPTLKLINATNLPKDATILNVGAGTSTVIDQLLIEGYTNLIANDLSAVALNTLKKRINSNKNVLFLEDDLLNPTVVNKLNNIAIWNDRAVLHFFLEQKQIDAYFLLLKKVLKLGGFVLIAVFAENGAEKCCGLPLKRYNVDMIQKELGSNFMLKKSFKYTFINPFGGKRPYIYTLFQRIK